MVDKILRGDVFLADLSPVIGSEQGGKRPVLIIQNDVGNHFSTTVIVAAITAKKLNLGSNGTLLSYLNNCVRLIRLEFLRK